MVFRSEPLLLSHSPSHSWDPAWAVGEPRPGKAGPRPPAFQREASLNSLMTLELGHIQKGLLRQLYWQIWRWPQSPCCFRSRMHILLLHFGNENMS